METTVNERLNLIVKTYENGRKAAFARKIGVSPQGVQELLAGRKGDPSFKVLVKIIENYPQVSTEWLILGEGSFYSSKANIAAEIQEHRRINEEMRLYASEEEIDDAYQRATKALAASVSKRELADMLLEAEGDMLLAQARVGRAASLCFAIRGKMSTLEADKTHQPLQ